MRRIFEGNNDVPAVDQPSTDPKFRVVYQLLILMDQIKIQDNSGRRIVWGSFKLPLASNEVCMMMIFSLLVQRLLWSASLNMLPGPHRRLKAFPNAISNFHSSDC
jgi:hypothetical protein